MRMSRPSSDRPIVNTRTRGEAAAKARAYAYACPESTKSPGAPEILPKNLRGEGAVAEAGRYETKGEEYLASVVDFEISAIDPSSGTSGA